MTNRGILKRWLDLEKFDRCNSKKQKTNTKRIFDALKIWFEWWEELLRQLEEEEVFESGRRGVQAI